MAVFNSAVLTVRGNELLVDAVAGDRIIFTRMVVGCGEYSGSERERIALERMTSLKDARQEFTFSDHKKISEQCVLLTAVISNKELDYSYKITEIGIYGKKLEDESDFLCSVAVTKSLEESDTFPPYNGLQECQIVQDYYVTISPDAEVTVNTQGACVLREEFETIKQMLLAESNKLKLLKDLIDGLGVDIGNIRTSFQAGVDTLYNKCVALGFTPAGKTPSNISDTISKIYTDRYNSGYSNGQAAVIANPTAYGIGSGGVVANAFGRSDTVTARGTFSAGAHSCLYSWMVYGNYKPEFTLRNITTGEYLWNKMKPNGEDQKPSVSQYNFNLSSPAVLELSVTGAGSNAGMAFGAAALV